MVGGRQQRTFAGGIEETNHWAWTDPIVAKLYFQVQVRRVVRLRQVMPDEPAAGDDQDGGEGEVVADSIPWNAQYRVPG